MRVIMTKTVRGSEDGIQVQLYKAEQIYDLGENLAASFIKSKCARPAPEPEKKPGKDKPADGGDDNKGGKGPDEDK